MKRYHGFIYQAGSWEAPQKVVVKVEVSSLGTNIRYVVTNLVQIRAKELYEKGYCARGAMELRIKEHKLYLKSDRSSCNSFYANQFRLFLPTRQKKMRKLLTYTFFRFLTLVCLSFLR